MMPTTERHARLFRNDRNQVLRIPREFELPGDEVIIRKVGDCLIVEPVKPAKKKRDLREILATLEPIEDELPDIDDGLPPLDDVDL